MDGGYLLIGHRFNFLNYEFSCEWYNSASTWSDSHSGHTSGWCHCVLLSYEPEDYIVVQLDNHTDYKDTLYLHAWIEYVSDD